MGFVMADVSAGWRRGRLFAERFKTGKEVGGGNADVDLWDGMWWLGDGSERVLNGGCV